MPKELIAIAPRTPAFREYEERALEPGEVRLRSVFSSPKHGTELRAYRGDTKDYTSPFDPERRIHVEGRERRREFPIHLGNTTIGTVVETGEGVTRFRKGDRVFGHLPIRETHTVPENRLAPAPEGMLAESIVYADPARVALHVVRDARICLGDRVAVLGLGAIGQMALRISRLQGARWIAASDPIKLRREAAAEYADLLLDPLKEDVGLIVKDETGKVGVDISLETTGAYSALNDALRTTGYGGVIVSCSYYSGSAQGLKLEGEWHRNRLTLISSRSSSVPLRDHPLWDFRRMQEEAFELLREGRLSVKGLLHPIVPFSEALEAYQEIDEAPAKSIKLGITYPD